MNAKYNNKPREKKPKKRLYVFKSAAHHESHL